jgi:hypothetical protein
MITKEQLLMGREVEFPITEQMGKDADTLLERVNALQNEAGCPIVFTVSSGYRPGHYNTDAHGAPNSSHCVCQAVDIHDIGEKLDNWLTDDLLTKYNLYREAPSHTPNWTHLTIRAPHSGHRTFLP